MGAQVTRLDYDWADDYHTHSRRRDAILRKYPQIRQLMVYDPVFKWKVLAMVTLQFASFYLLSFVHNFGILFLVAYFFGGVINHSLTLAIHDISHNQAFGYSAPLKNRLFGMMANLPIGLPTSVTFHKYHMDHHRYLGKQADTDVPTEWEGRFFNNSKRKVVWLMLQPLFYAIRPLVVSPLPVDKLEVLNAIVQLSFDWLVYRYLGLHILLYMILGTLVCMGLHPVAGHFLTEHYVFFHEEDYLHQLRTHQKVLSEKLLVPETFSYYGSFNLITFNVGYHVEHHDFPNIPSSKLPLLKEIAPEFYLPLCSHTSWWRALLTYIIDPRMSPFARIRRKEIFTEYMNGNKATEASLRSEETILDDNGNCQPDAEGEQVSKQSMESVRHRVSSKATGSGEQRDHFRALSQSTDESAHPLIRAHYAFYQ